MKGVAIIIAASFSAPASASPLGSCDRVHFHGEIVSHRVIADGVVAWTDLGDGVRGGPLRIHAYNCASGEGISALVGLPNSTSKTDVIADEKRLDKIFREAESSEWNDLVEEFVAVFDIESDPHRRVDRLLSSASTNQICGCVAAFPEMLGDGEPSHLGDRNDRT